MKNTIERITMHQYHRNGIGGRGFFAVSFLYTDPHDERTVELVATIDPEQADSTRVIDPKDVTLQFRGDFFFREIAKILAFTTKEISGFWSSDALFREALADKLMARLQKYPVKPAR